MPILVSKNNYLLPLRDEDYDLQETTRVGIEMRAAHEVPVIFHQLNTTHWEPWFQQLSTEQLREMCRRLEIYVPGKKDKKKWVDHLTRYWQKRIERESS